MAISRQQMINEALPHREIFNEFCASVDFKTEQTKKTYISILSRYINYLEEKRIEKPRESAVMGYKDYLRKQRHNSGATLQLTNIVLRKFYRWTERLEYYPNLAVDLISENVTPTFKRQALTIDEANLLLDYAAEESTKGIVELRNYTFIYLILNIGLRTIEVSRADIEDIKKEGEFTYLYVQGKEVLGTVSEAFKSIKGSAAGGPWAILIAIIAVLLLQNENFRALLKRILEIVQQLIDKIVELVGKIIEKLKPILD